MCLSVKYLNAAEGGTFIITYQKVYLLHQGQEDNTFCLFDGFQ
jgi:hypothetical protein